MPPPAPPAAAGTPRDLFSPSPPLATPPAPPRDTPPPRATPPSPPPVPSISLDPLTPVTPAKGLNIAGVQLVPLVAVDQTAIERRPSPDDNAEDEDEDALPEMAPSPHRLFFGDGAAPPSPAWQSFDQPASPGFPSTSTTGASPRPPTATTGTSLALPQPSPLGPRAAASRDTFDPTPTHGIHSRNLSLFFPHPGAPGAPVTPRTAAAAGLLDSPDDMAATTTIPSDKNVFGGTDNWSFAHAHARGGTDAQGLLTPDARRSKRRGHHHKHSLSHNFFSFLDPTQTNPSLAPPTSASPSTATPNPSPNPDATPASVPMPLLPPSTADQTLSPLPSSSKSDPHTQFLASAAVLELLIGAGLWIEGQMSGWRCLAGVGYLVVFDAVGVAVGIVARGEGHGWSSVRRPYGPSRLVSLLCFAQSLFLVFAAVYIAKESLEQVILGSGAHEHGVGAHGHGDGGGGAHSHAHAHTHGQAGDAASDGDERDFPHFLLLSAASASIFSAGALGNHSKLVDAVGPLFLPSTYLSLPFVSAWPRLMANPFSLTVAGASLGILLSTLIVPPTALHSLDSLISLLLTLLVSTLAYPPTIAFAHILLQTAPPGASPQMLALRRALKEIRQDRRVLGLGTVRCWAVSVGEGGWDDFALAHAAGATTPGAATPGSVSSPMLTPRQSMEFPSFSALSAAVPPSPTSASWSSRKDDAGAGAGAGEPLVITLAVHVHPDLGDSDVLEVTRMVWGKVSAAVAGGGGAGGAGIGSGGAGTGAGAGGQREGEVSVQVKRGWEGMDE